jgi:hypothetical protein
MVLTIWRRGTFGKRYRFPPIVGRLLVNQLLEASPARLVAMVVIVLRAVHCAALLPDTGAPAASAFIVVSVGLSVGAAAIIAGSVSDASGTCRVVLFCLIIGLVAAGLLVGLIGPPPGAALGWSRCD